jgi:uncharacterized protein (TIRG00374 family)
MMKIPPSVSRLLRLALGVAAIMALIGTGHITLDALTGALGRPDLLALAAFLLLALVPLSALRWLVLLHALDFKVSFAWTVRVIMITLFFSTFLPGAYGGDAVRVAMAYRHAGRGLSRLTFSVLVDRLLGLLALATIGLCLLPELHARFNRGGYFLPLALLIVLIVGACAFGLFLGERTASWLARLPRFLWSVHHVVRASVDALHSYARKWPSMLGLFALSVLMFLMLLESIRLLGIAMHFDTLSVSQYYSAGALAMIANSLPLTPGGLGVGEAAFAQVAHLLEARPSQASYATVFLAMRVLNALIGMLGVLPYIADRKQVLSAVENVRQNETH